jgi:hypothetical protein
MERGNCQLWQDAASRAGRELWSGLSEKSEVSEVSEDRVVEGGKVLQESTSAAATLHMILHRSHRDCCCDCC